MDNGEYDKLVLKTQMSHGLVMMYFYYNEIALTLPNDISAKYMDRCKWFYKECYCKVEKEISDMDLRVRYFEILSSSDNYKGYFPAITFYDFCEELGN